MKRFFQEWFPYGTAPTLLLVVALLSGGYIALHPAGSHNATLRLWTFSVLHSEPYQRAVPDFERAHPGTTVDVQLVHITAVTSRLRAAFWANLDVPDLVEVEISKAGSFFRGPVEDIGFIDLTQRLKESGFYDRLVQTRFAPYTNRGHIYGLPHDIHPVMLAYRRDLAEAAGIDVTSLDTWEKFIEAGRKYTIPGKRYMMRLSDSDAGSLECLLFQRDGGYFDASGKVIMDNEAAVETMKWYVPMVAGPNRISADLGGAGSVLTQTIEEGYVLFHLCPDWMTKGFFEREIPRVSGKMALTPLPAARPGGRRTSTMGGTMVGITKNCKNPDLAWKLATRLYLDKEFLAERFANTNILPPLKDAWEMPVFKEPRPYW